MNRHLRPVVGLCVCAGILFSGYLLVPAPGVDARSNVRRAVASLQAVAPAITISAVRAPVPLLITPHSAFFIEESQQAAVSKETIVGESREKVENTDSSIMAARTMIEADGYKNVSALIKTRDGVWTGIALRGATQVAIVVDANGNVSTR